MNWLIFNLLFFTAGIPTEFDAVVSSPSLWSMIGTNGEVRELWGGPGSSSETHWGEPPNVLKLSAFGLMQDGDHWVDLRTIDYDRSGSRPGYLILQNELQGVGMRATAMRTVDESPVFLHYRFDRPREFRFRIDFQDEDGFGEVKTYSKDGVVTIQTKSFGKLAVATNPPGSVVADTEHKNSLIIDIPKTNEYLIALTSRYNEEKTAENPFIVNWIVTNGGIEDSIQSRMVDRIHVKTGVDDFDRLFAASIDAIEANRFGSGVVIAGSDRWYKNTFLRDGTYSIIGLDMAGKHEAADGYYRYWIKEGGFSWGGENEAQQPAIAILGIWIHSRLRANGTEFLQEAYPYVKKYGDYYAERIANEGMIDTAEEWICQVATKTAWPNAEIYAGLKAAYRIADELDENDDLDRWKKAADTLQQAIFETAYDEERERFIPLAGPAGEIKNDPKYPPHHFHNGPVYDTRVDSAMLMLARDEIFGDGFGVVDVDDPRFASTQVWIHKLLKQPDQSLSRFDANKDALHYRAGEWGAWVINSAWASNIEWLRGRTDRAWRHLLDGIVRKNGFDAQEALYQLPEQWDRNGRPVPTTRFLTWSHGEFLTASLYLLLGIDLDAPDADIGLNPSLPPESNEAFISNFRFKNWLLDFRLQRQGDTTYATVTAFCMSTSDGKDSITIHHPKNTVTLKHEQSVVLIGRTENVDAKLIRDKNAAERALLYSRILLGEEFFGALKNTPANDYERFIRMAEDRFDEKMLVDERKRRQKEIEEFMEVTKEK